VYFPTTQKVDKAPSLFTPPKANLSLLPFQIISSSLPQRTLLLGSGFASPNR